LIQQVKNFIEEEIQPLKVFIVIPSQSNIEVQRIKANINLNGKIISSSSPTEKEKTKKKKEQKKEEKKESLLRKVLPTIQREYMAFFQKIKKKATLNISSTGKYKSSIPRKIVYVPKLKPIKIYFPPAPAVVKITVLPDGRVIEVKFLKRTGNYKVDNLLRNLLKNIRFAPIKENIIQEITIVVKYEITAD
jgi:TonB family protein